MKSDYWLRNVHLSVCPSVRMESSAFIARIFKKFDICVFFRKSVERIHVSVKFEKNKGYFIQEDLCAF